MERWFLCSQSYEICCHAQYYQMGWQIDQFWILDLQQKSDKNSIFLTASLGSWRLDASLATAPVSKRKGRV
jgi:hypothetical protein